VRALAKKKKCNFCDFNGVLVLVRYDKVIAQLQRTFLLDMAALISFPKQDPSFFVRDKYRQGNRYIDKTTQRMDACVLAKIC
jgi:hypothetical protein